MWFMELRFMFWKQVVDVDILCKARVGDISKGKKLTAEREFERKYSYWTFIYLYSYIVSVLLNLNFKKGNIRQRLKRPCACNLRDTAAYWEFI